MNEKFIIGSTALKHWYSDYPNEPKDIDYVVNIASMWSKEEGVEYLENDILYVNQHKYVKDGYLTVNALYTLKASHLICRDVNWDKHMWQFQWMKKKGCKLDVDLFYQLYEYWKDLYGNKRSDLDMSAEEFFDNTLSNDYSHDWLHTLIQNPPTYTLSLIHI